MRLSSSNRFLRHIDIGELPVVTTVLWVVIALAGLWLGLLGIAMATGLTMIMRAGAEIPDDYWRSLLGYR